MFEMQLEPVELVYLAIADTVKLDHEVMEFDVVSHRCWTESTHWLKLILECLANYENDFLLKKSAK